MTERKRVSIYARVSTKDQKPENQLIDLRNYCKQRGLKIIGEFVDHGISGGKDDRPQLKLLMDSARKRRFDILLVWKFDRFARSTRHLINTLDELKNLGIDFVSYQEALDTTSPAGKLVFTMVSAIAEFERSLIQERVIAGLNRARIQGKTLGRPRLTISEEAKELRAKGMSLREIAKQLNVSHSWVALAVTRAVSKKPLQKRRIGSDEKQERNRL